MKYFDERYFNGSLTDAECEKRDFEYENYIKNSLSKIDFLFRTLCSINFHDGKIVRFIQSEKEVTIDVLIGDLQNGYQKVIIKFEVSNIQITINKDEILATEIFISTPNKLSFFTKNYEDNYILFECIKEISIVKITENDYFSA